MSQVIFLYLTREGQTRRICERMAKEAEQLGHQVALLALDAAGAPAAVAAAERVVIGASIRYGHLPAALYRFVSTYCKLLDERDSAFFCINLTARKPGKDSPTGSAYMRRFLRKSVWQPGKLAVFAGALYYTRYRWFDREIIRLIMRITGGPTDPHQDVEFTDWERVDATLRQWLGSESTDS